MRSMSWGRLRNWALIGCATAALAQGAAWADSAKQKFAIPAQDLASALTQFADQADREILFSPDATLNKRANVVKGEYSPEEALTRLLSGTNLTFRATGGSTLLIEKAPQRSSAAVMQSAEEPAPAPQAPSAAGETPSSDSGRPVEKVTVTGTRIKGAKQASPVVTITRDDMKAQGSTDLGQVARSLPQSFAGGQNPGIGLGAGGLTNQNITNSSSINLRGLGQDATLTLLNGTRLPYDGFTQATDVASIPLAAIDRMEVLLDGASAIYGSDAVAGVANIILKRDYDGVEFAARWGEASQGGYEQQQYTAVGGTVWSTGGFIATADFTRNSGIRAGDRDYVTLPKATSIYPPLEQRGVLFSGHQQLGDSIEVMLDAFYTERDGIETLNLLPTAFAADGIVSRDTTIWGIMPSVRLTLPNEWTVRLHGALGQNESISDQTTIRGGVPNRSVACYCNDAESIGLEAEGGLFDLPGGEARLAMGGGYRGNDFKSKNLLTGVTRGGDDSSQFIYGELYLPVISAEQNIPLIYRFSLEGAVRYEDYESFGETTTPKVGAIWGLSSDIDLKATWGKSFKVPTLQQQHSPIFLDLFSADFLGVGYPPGVSGVLFFQGGNPSLTPERAETFTAGMNLHPDFIPGLSVEVSYFDIDYQDRIVNPVTSLFQALANPIYAEFIVFNPTVAQQNAAFALAGQAVGTFPQGVPPPPLGPYDPARVVAIMDARYVNSASQKINGVDLLARYSFDLFDGNFTASGGATWLEIEQRLSSLAPIQPGTGRVFLPTEFRGRIGGAWASDEWLISATLNHTAGVTNNLVAPFEEGDGWTTVDLVVDYTFETGPLGGELELTLGVQNLFNNDPPLLSPLFNAYANYDSTNYNALGRVVNVTLTQRF